MRFGSCSRRSTRVRRRWSRACRATRSAAAAGLVAAADIAIAASDAVFAFSEVKLGIIPAVISPFALAKIGSERRAALLPHGRAVRRRDRASDRARARGRRRPRRRGRPRRRRAPVRRPAGGAVGEAPDPRAANRPRDRALDRRSASKRRGPGRVCARSSRSVRRESPTARRGASTSLAATDLDPRQNGLCLICNTVTGVWSAANE